MGDKITWKELYSEFRKTYPTLSKLAVWYRPQDWMTILIYFSDGTKIKYDGFEKKAAFVEETWK